jgi:hypothetical protein
MRRAEDALEHLDRPVPAADLAAALADIGRLNAWFGGHALSLREVRRLAACWPPPRPLQVVDVGGGRGDFAVELVRWARRAGRPIRVVLLERDAGALALARSHCAAYPEICLVRGDAGALPLRDGAAGIVTTTLVLHHLGPDAAVASLAEMRRVAALGAVLNDLLRTRLSLALVWLATRLFARHPFSRHDGPLSVRRAYAPAELETLARRARLGPLRVSRYPLLGRLVAVVS